MLAALLANNQNVAVAERPATVHVDRGGGGPLWGPGYDIVDIMTAVQLFPEVAGEDPVARAVRRTRWIGDALPKIKEAREKREAAAFITGATLADAAAEERHQAVEAAANERRKLVDQLKIEQLVEIIDSVRRVPVAPPRRSSGIAVVLALGVGVVLGVAVARRGGARSHPSDRTKRAVRQRF